MSDKELSQSPGNQNDSNAEEHRSSTDNVASPAPSPPSVSPTLASPISSSASDSRASATASSPKDVKSSVSPIPSSPSSLAQRELWNLVKSSMVAKSTSPQKDVKGSIVSPSSKRVSSIRRSAVSPHSTRGSSPRGTIRPSVLSRPAIDPRPSKRVSSIRRSVAPSPSLSQTHHQQRVSSPRGTIRKSVLIPVHVPETKIKISSTSAPSEAEEEYMTLSELVNEFMGEIFKFLLEVSKENAKKRHPAEKWKLPGWVTELNKNQLSAFMAVQRLLKNMTKEGDEEEEPRPSLEKVMECFEEVDVELSPSRVDKAMKAARQSRLPFEEFMYTMGCAGSTKIFFSGLAMLRMHEIRVEIRRYEELLKDRAHEPELDFFHWNQKVTSLQEGKFQRSARKSSKKPQSPYAQPIPFVTHEHPVSVAPIFRAGENRAPVVMQPPVYRKMLVTKEMPWRRAEVIDDTTSMQHTLKILARSGNSMAKLPRLHLLLSAVSNFLREEKFFWKKMEVLRTPALKMATRKSIGESQKQWMEAKMRVFENTLPLPSAPNSWVPYTQVYSIRKNARNILRQYYDVLRSFKTLSAWEHWKSMKIESFSSNVARRNYVDIFEAYHPCQEKFVPVRASYVGISKFHPFPKPVQGWVNNF